MKICINGVCDSFPAPISVAEAVAALQPELENEVLGCFERGAVLELNNLLKRETLLHTISYSDEEGRRIYERSLRFVFLAAVRRRFPDAQVRIEHSIGQGVYVELEHMRLSLPDVLAIEAEMRDIINEDLPFTRHRWTRQQAIDYFRDTGDEDKARLLSYRPYDYFNVYECDGMYEYFYGAMLPSTGKVPVFRLQQRSPGLIILLPDKQSSQQPAPYVSLPKHMAAFAESNYWCKVLNCTTAADLNDLIAGRSMRDFIRVNEALHDKSLAEIAQDIINRHARAVFIAGPSSSGKTTFANRLSIHLRVNGYRPYIVSMDDFYLDRDMVPLEADGKPDLEAISALDLPYFKDCLAKLLSGQVAMMPEFSFKTGRRKEELKPVQLDHLQPVIVEGIHGLNPALHEGIDSRAICRVYISALTSLNLDTHNRIRTTDVRLLRRIVRDYQFRNTKPLDTLAMWDSVRRGEEKWIFPFQEQADIVFNSALHYELPILKTISYEMLKDVPTEDPNFLKCNRLLKILNYFLPVDDIVLKEIPPLSILREFIGGNTLYISSERA